MTLPRPEPGLVIHYAYLWTGEAAQGQEEGGKDRPCAIVIAENFGDVLVVPITHRPPAQPDIALSIPPAIKRLLGLDDEPPWVILNESNVFPWPGPDLRPVPKRSPRQFAYGFLPPRYFAELRRRWYAIDAAARGARVRRTE